MLPEGVDVRGSSIRIWFIYRGKRYRETLKGWQNTATNIKKAGRLRAVIVSEISDGTFKYAERFPNSKHAAKLDLSTSKKNNLTLAQLVEIWLSIKEVDLTPSTMKKTRSLCRTCVHILGANRLASAITHEDILRLRKELLTGETRFTRRGNKTGRTVRTVNNYMATFGEFFRFATKSGYYPDNPFSDIKGLKQSRKLPDPLEQDEFDRLISHPRLREQERNLWTTACFTGLRHGELCALAWEDIDLDAGTLHVRRNLTSQGYFKTPKTTSGDRVIELLSPALEALKSQQALSFLRPADEIEVMLAEKGQYRTDVCRWVFITGLTQFRNNCNNNHYCPSGLGQLWDSCVKRTGIRRRNPYHTRHTFACWMLTAGANPSFIAQQMGHKDAQMVFNIYGKWMPSGSRDQVAMLNSKFSSCPIRAPFCNRELK